ncbi:MAG TPA: 3-dehydro-L-gulonate 2-dehydrogenase [Rectinemataceae bacterium]|nr:3-dehydro-L-gulonate 2-dehydrogenase [Rectinemataceae bacterium]
MGTIRIDFERMSATMAKALELRGFDPERAGRCARLFADASLDGVYTHGLARFPRFIEYLQKGYVKATAVPRLEQSFGSWERWDGGLGPGNLNAAHAMARAIELSRGAGMGAVALRNTNHWMRGGSYGWQAAEAGCIGLAWTNTTPNLPAWGSTDCVLGNNPLVIAVPRSGGHIVLDMAMSQFSYGKLEAYRDRGEELPVDGGFDSAGRPTRDPVEILASRRPMPIGYWKGSGLSMLLDLVGAVLSGGDSLAGLARREAEFGLTQFFLAFDLSRLPEGDSGLRVAQELVAFVHSARPEREGGTVSYPGERTLRTREENLARGIPADEGLWAEVERLASRGP